MLANQPYDLSSASGTLDLLGSGRNTYTRQMDANLLRASLVFPAMSQLKTRIHPAFFIGAQGGTVQIRVGSGPYAANLALASSID